MMENWFLYVLKVIISSYAFYALYYLMMRRDTHFSMGRSYLLLSLGISLIIPFVPIVNGENIIASATNYEFSMEQIVVIPNDSIIADNINYFSIAYITITCLLLLRFVFRLVNIARIAGNSTYTEYNGYKLYNMQNELPSFSFLNMIFINRQKYSEQDIKIILSHEEVHVRFLHSIDIILIELIQAVFWINPSLFLYRKSLVSIHEYQADRHTLVSGVGVSEYGMLILKESLNTKSIAFSNNFNSSIIKRRIAMMKINESRSFSLLKPLAGMAMLVILVFAFSFIDTEGKKPVDKQISKETTATKLEAADVAPACDLTELQKNIVYPESARKEGVMCKVFVKAYINEKGKITKTEASVNENGKVEVVKRGSKYHEFALAAIKAVKKTKFKAAVKNNKNIGSWITIPVQFRLTEK